MADKAKEKQKSLHMFYHDEDLRIDPDNENDANDFDVSNELLADFSNQKVINRAAGRRAIIHDKPSKVNKDKTINEKFIQELSNRNEKGEPNHISKKNEKSIESNLEAKYGQGYKLLKLAGYKIGSGLGAKEQGITDPLEIKVRKKKAGISQEDEYENPLQKDKKNNFLLGRKRQGFEKAFDETNEEMNHFEQLIEAYTVNQGDNEDVIENMLIKAKEFTRKGGKELSANKWYELHSLPSQPDLISKLIGKQFNLHPLLTSSKGNCQSLNNNKQLLIELIDKTKSKVINYLNAYYSNRNNRIVIEKLNETTQDDQLHQEENYNQKQQFASQLQTISLSERVNGNVTEYIQQYLTLYNAYPQLLRDTPKLCLCCLNQSIKHFQAQYQSAPDFLDEHKALSFKANARLVKDLINCSFSEFNEKDIGRDHMFSIAKAEQVGLNEKAGRLYSFFIHEVLLRFMNDVIINQWNIKEYNKLIRFFQLYKEVIPIDLMETVSEMIAKKIIDFIMTSIAFTPEREDIFIHNWIHPWFDILPLKTVDLIAACIQKKLLDDILAWNIEDDKVNAKLIAMLIPWKPVLAGTFWEELEGKFLCPKLRFMFASLRIQPDDQFIEPFMIMFKLIDSALVHKERCVAILKERFFPEWMKTLNHWLKQGLSKEKMGEIQQWYKGWKEFLNEHLPDCEEINRQLKDGIILIYSYTKK